MPVRSLLGVGWSSPRRQVSWLPDQRSTLPLPKASSLSGIFAVYSAGEQLPGHSGGTAPDSHRLPS